MATRRRHPNRAQDHNWDSSAPMLPSEDDGPASFDLSRIRPTHVVFAVIVAVLAVALGMMASVEADLEGPPTTVVRDR